MSTGELVIDVRGVTKKFGGRAVVNDIAMQVRPGEIHGFLGPNGSGKTTFLRMLCGLLKPDAGSGQCLGYDILRQSAEIKKHAGYMTQRFSFYEDLTIEENLDFIARLYEMPERQAAVARSLERLTMTARRRQLAGTLRAVVCQHLLRRADGHGRAIAVEVMLNNDAISSMIRKGKAFQIPSVIQSSKDQGMQSMDSELVRLVKAGVVSQEDAYAKANDKKSFESALAPAKGAPVAEPAKVAAAGPRPMRPGSMSRPAVRPR